MNERTKCFHIDNLEDRRQLEVLQIAAADRERRRQGMKLTARWTKRNEAQTRRRVNERIAYETKSKRRRYRYRYRYRWYRYR